MPRQPASVLLATCAEIPAGHEDEHSGVQALLDLSVRADWAVWDDPRVDWAAADLVVVRSTWDYARRRDEFLTWARSVPRLANPVDVLAWNSDKTYLKQLADAGVPVVPTTWYAPGDNPVAPDGESVVKPAISAGARDTARHADPEAARAHAVSLLDARRAVMVQPYLHAIDSVGETGLVWMADRFSHAFGKGALLARGADPAGGLFVHEQVGAREASAAEREVAERALDALAAVTPVDRCQLLYARVDLVPGPDGGPVLLELELAEPSLWFTAEPDAPARWARAVADRLEHMASGAFRG